MTDEELTCWSELDTLDDLLDGLLGASALPFLNEGVQREETTRDLPAASASPLNASTTKRKRVRLSRPSHEIQRLRQQVTELESLLALHAQRLQQPRCLITAKDGASEDELDMWRNVATRQYKFLRDAQLENEQLRGQVQHQRELVQNFLRLIHRARSRLPAPIPRLLAEQDAGIVTAKRKYLFDVASDMYGRVDAVFAVEPFISGTHELRETTICHHQGDSIPPGTLLASTSIRRIVPHSLHGLSELLWNVTQSDEAFQDAYKIEHREESSHTHTFVYSVAIQTPYGPVMCHGVGLRTRHHQAHRDVVITTGSMWPDSSTPSPQNAVAYDFREWAVVQPSHSGSSVRNQVLVRFETSRPYPEAADLVSREQVTVLQHFIAQAHNFIVEQEQRRLDAILLGQVQARWESSVGDPEGYTA